MDYESVPKILGALKDAGFAADNMVFGSGGALLQKLNRDTFKCAFKCSEITVNGVARDVFKETVAQELSFVNCILGLFRTGLSDRTLSLTRARHRKKAA